MQCAFQPPLSGVSWLLRRVADQQVGLGGPRDLGGLAGPGAGTDPDHYGTATFDGHEQHVDGRGVAVPDRDPVTRADSGAGQLGGEHRCSPVEFALVQRCGRMDEVGRLVGVSDGVVAHGL